MNSNFTDAQSITQNVRRADNNISFVKSLGSFIQNSDFKYGYIDFLNGKDSAGAYIWKALSAIGQDVNSIVYSNVLDYIDAVCNIDTCSIKSLKSMMKLVGSSYSIFGNIDMLPLEVMQLLDVLSISRKYLLQDDKVKSSFAEDIQQNNVVDYDEKIDSCLWKYQYLRNAFIISAPDLPQCMNGIYGRYDLIDDNAYSYIDGPSYLSDDASRYKKIPYNVAINMDSYCSCIASSDVSSNISGLICRSYESNTSWKIVKYNDLHDNENYCIVDRNGKLHSQFNAEEFEKNVSINENYEYLDSIEGYIQCIPEHIALKTTFIDDAKYKEYIEFLYKTLLSSFVTMRYNTKLDGVLPIYCYLTDEYFKTNNYYESIDNSADSRRRFKNKNNIPLAFDEKTIVDNIDNGTDSLDNYFGSELELLNIEIAERAKTLSFNIADATYINDNSDGIVEKYTRYSYYRKAKVLEYMHFIDNQYYAGEAYLSSNSIYAFNPNYYEVEKRHDFDAESHVVKQLSAYTGNVDEEIRFSIIDSVAKTLANLTMYIAKLREKVRLQTRKNYMKGTNNLIRYVVNEYLVDLARNSPIFRTDSLSSNYLKNIRAELSSNNIDNVEVVEYYDTTEYYNVNTEMSDPAANSRFVNDRYWENIFTQDSNGIFSSRNGIDIPQDQIHNFYLSTLNLKNQISGADSNVYAFLSTIFDLGASTSYIAKDGEFVTKLSTGQYSDEVHAKYVKLSNDYELLSQYSNGYAFDVTHTAKQQLSDLAAYMTAAVSSQYFVGISSNYNDYHPTLEELSAAVVALQDEYGKVLEDNAIYLAKSASKYSYNSSTIDEYNYKHDYYIDNNDVYNSTLILDQLNDLRLFVLDDANMHVWAFKDGLSTLAQDYNILNGKVNNLKMDIYSSNITFNDIYSEYMDVELQCIDNALQEAFNTRVQQLNTMVATGKSIAEDQYSSLLADFLESSSEYKAMEKQFSEILAQYKNDFVNYFGDSKASYIFKQNYEYAKDDENEDGCPYVGNIEDVKVQYKTVSITPFDLSATGLLKDKCEKAIAWMNQEIGWENAEDVEVDDEEQLPVIQFGSQYNLPNSPYLVSDPGIQAALTQMLYRIEQLEEKLLQSSISAEVVPLNASIKSIYENLASTIEYPGDIVLTAINDGGIPLSTKFEDLAKQLKIQYISKASKLDEVNKLYKNDNMYSVCGRLINRLVGLSGEWLGFDANYQSFIGTSDVANYLEGYSIPEKFTPTEYASLEAFSAAKDATARSELLQKIDAMFNEYFNIQSNYTEFMQQLKVAMPQYYYTNNYLEVDLSNVLSSLDDNIQYNTDLATIKINQQMALLNKSLNSLAEGISASIDLSGSTILQLFAEEIQKYDIYNDSQYIAAKALFYQYAGLSDCQAPFFNYKNITHPTRQLHNFFWNFIEVDKYAQIANNAFDSVYVEELETDQALSAVSKYIGNCGQLIDVWKNNIQDFTGYSTRYIDSTHAIPSYVGTFEVVDYDGAFYPPAIEMFTADPDACISTLTLQYSILDNINALRLSDKMEDELSRYDTQEFKVLAWTLLNGSTYEERVPNGNLRELIDIFIQENNVPGYNYTGEPVLWMVSTKENFAKYIADNIKKSFFERFYYPLSLSKKNYQFIANQLSDPYIQDRILDITNSHLRKDIYDIYNYGLDAYDNMYILYKQYNVENPDYQLKKNTLGQMWIRLKNHPIAFPITTQNAAMSQVELSSANEYLRENKNAVNWCYDFNFSNNKRLICFTCKNNQQDLPAYFRGKYKYSWQAISLVQQSTNVDLQRAVLKLNNPDDIPDDIVVQPYMNKYAVPTLGNDTYAYQFIGSYAPSLYAINLVYVKTNFTYNEKTQSINAYLDCPPKVIVLKATNETSNIEIQNQLEVEWNDEFMLSSNLSAFEFNNDQAVFSHNFTTNTLTFAFLGDLKLENGSNADAYKPSTCDNISLSSSSNGPTIDDPVAKEMNSHDIFTDCVVVANVKPKALSLEMLGHLKLYNMNADASYLPLYAGKDQTGYIDKMRIAGQPYYSFELLGNSKNLDEWLRIANPYANTSISLEEIYESKVNGRIYEQPESTFEEYSSVEYLDMLKKKLQSTAVERYNPLLNSINSTDFTWSIDVPETGLTYEKPDDVRVVVYNVDLYGKNPYYVCTLRDLVESRNPSGGKQASYNPIATVYQQVDVSAKIFNDNSRCKAVSTQPYAWLDSIDNNNLNGISAITAVFDEELSSLTFKFERTTDQEYSLEDIFVPASQIKVLLFNPTYLEVFNNYHLFDTYGLIYTNDIDHPIVDKVGDNWYISYDKSRFAIHPYYIDQNGFKCMLSDVDFNEEDALSDVYVLKSYDRLHFKYNEEMIYDISSDMYYYPSINIKYPYSPGSYLEQLGFKNELRSGSFFSNAFDDTNYYSFRIDDPAEIADLIGNVSIGIEARDLEIITVFEDYISSDALNKYDYLDTRNFEHLQFFNISDDTSYDWKHPVTEILDDSKVLTCDDLEKAIDKLGTDEIPTSLVAVSGDTSTLGMTKIPHITFRATRNTVDLSEALKIYVSYKKEEDQTITLYFNYTNYLDTPFVRVENNQPVQTVIDGTYLKLAAGEEGQLDLMIQFKYYAKQIIYGVANVVLVTYKIFNLSDTKPKFLIYKQQTVSPDAYEYIDVDGQIILNFNTKEVRRQDLEVIDGKYYVNAEIDLTSSKASLYNANQFVLLYNNALLQYAGILNDYCTVNSLKAGALKVMTYSASVNKFVFKFLVKNADSILKQQNVVAEFNIEDVEFYYANYELIKNVKVNSGTITFLRDANN